MFAEDQATVDAATSALTSAISALTEQTYTVTFVGKDGNTLKEQTVKKGESATAPEAPVVDGFSFSGWSGSFENVTADVTVTAQYTEHGKADYTALNAAIAQAEGLTEDDYTVQSWSALQTALTNAKAVDKNLFAEDQATVDAATSALTSAISALTEQTYTVTFVGKDGNTLKEQTVKKGESATAPEAPVVDGFSFSGWSGSFENVTADVTVTAQYTEHGKADYTALNAAIAQAEGLTEDDYTVQSWSALQTALTNAKAVDKNLFAEDQATVDAATSALTSAISALTEQTYTVTFVGKDGNTLKEQTVKKGESATAPEAPVVDGFSFSGWSGSFENVTADVTVTAQYTEHGKADYTALNAAIAQAEGLTEDDYTVQSWSALQTALTNAKAVDKNLFAEDQATVDAATSALTAAISALAEQTYTVTFKDWDGTELKQQTVKKGESAVAPTNMHRDNYTFSGWSGSYTNVTADVTVIAQYTENGKAVYTALDNAIASAEVLVESAYTMQSWATMQLALNAAKSVDRNLFADSQSVVDNAESALRNAISSLVKLDRLALASTIQVATSLYTNAEEGTSVGQYASGSKKTLNEAIAVAQQIYAQVSVSQEMLDNARIQLQAAIDNFKAQIVVVDKSALQQAISSALTAIQKADGNVGNESGQYPQSAVDALQSAITASQNVYETVSSQYIIDEQVVTLNNAIETFLASRNAENVDMTVLSTLIATAENLLETSTVGDKDGQYPINTYVELHSACQGAKVVRESQSPKQEDVNIQVKLLQDAIESFMNSKIHLAIDEITSSIVVYAVGHMIVVEGAENEDIQIIDIKGCMIENIKDNSQSTLQVYVNKVGCYFVKIGTEVRRVIVK